MRIVLGSQSPRRRELLAGLGIDFRVVNIHADESFPSHLQGGDIPLHIAQKKAEAYLPQLQDDELLITADTIVWCNGQQLGKPADQADARRMIAMLSGCTHQVYTGVCVYNKGVMQSFVDCTDVTFRTLSTDEIDYYVREYQPLDKAGAYGIQEWIGYAACTRLHGSYFNVMGLPTEPLYELLKPYLAQ